MTWRKEMMRHRVNLRGNLASWKAIVGTGVLAGGLALFGGTPSAKADDCQERIIKADHRLHEAAEKHGWESKQAAHARQELAEARSYCWEHGHRWWDVEGSRWHTDRDWDDHDHDHR
jgi:hypothetical protein